MGTRKILPELVPFDGGLNTKSNPLTYRPNEWTSCQNVLVCKPYGFKTGTVEENHVAQTRPPMRLFFTSAFDVAVASVATEVKPLVGATQTAQDNQPNQWQEIARGTLSEGWGITGSGAGVATDTLTEVAGLTLSDGNNIALQYGLSEGQNNAEYQATVTLARALSAGNIGNNNTNLFIDYSEAFQDAGGAPNKCVKSMALRIGLDSSNYLEYTLPVQALVTAAPRSYFTNRYSVSLRSFNSKVGAKSFGEIVNNLVWIQVAAVSTTGTLPINVVPFFTVDSIRLDVDYLGFFGDFTVGQAYKQVTIDSFDPTTSTWSFPGGVTSGGFYPERRLSVGNGSIAFESDIGGTPILEKTLSTPIDTTISGFPTFLMMDYHVQGHAKINAIIVRIGSDSANYKILQINNPSADGNFVFKSSFAGLGSSGSPNLAALSYIAILISHNAQAEPTSPKVYLNNLRFAPYTAGPGFPVQSGNIRDSFLYDAGAAGVDTRFITSCGDALFLGTSLLSSNSWYIQSKFTNWSMANPNLPKRFVFATITNPNSVATQTLIADVPMGATSITLTALPLNLHAGAQITVDPTGASPELAYVASTYVDGSSTVPLTTALLQPHSSGSTVTWTNPNEPLNQTVFVNGADGLYTADVYTYPLPGGGTYQYPRVTKIAPEAFSTAIVHKGYLMLSGDPNHPNRTVCALISGLPIIPAQSFIELDLSGTVVSGDSINALWSFEKYLLHIRKTDVWITYGDSINNFSTDKTSADRGALGQNHVAQAQRRLFFLAYDGVYEFAGLKTEKISDNINDFFQTNDLTAMQSGFLFYNPIREILCCVLPNSTAYLLDPLTTATQFMFTYSLQKGAWGRIHGNIPGTFQPINPRYTVFSAVFYGGGSSAPAVFFSSTTMVEWDNTPDTESNVVSIQMAPNGYGNHFQNKVFDKFYMWSKNFSLTNGFNGTAFLKIVLGFNAFNSQTMALTGQVASDADGMLELFTPGGSWGKAAAPSIFSTYSVWATPIQFEFYGLSHWPTEEL